MAVMDIAWIAALGVLGGAVILAVVQALMQRWHPRRADIDELANEVERLSRIVRKERMRAMRQAALDLEPEGQQAAAALEHGAAPAGAPMSKPALRAHVAKLRVEGRL